eukprot:UN01990
MTQVELTTGDVSTSKPQTSKPKTTHRQTMVQADFADEQAMDAMSFVSEHVFKSYAVFILHWTFIFVPFHFLKKISMSS